MKNKKRTIIELIMTYDCNLACKYCYIKQKNKFLNKKTFDLFKSKLNNILNILDMNYYYEVSYFGGEPLLNWDMIKYAHEYFKNDKYCNFDMIITNGLELNEEKINYIKNNNLGVSLSFDGIWQNENRPLKKNLKSSFEEYKNKKELLQKISPCGKTMVAPQNIDTLTENFVFFVEDWGCNSPDFSIVRDDIWTDNDVEKFDYEIKRLREKVEEYFKKNKFNLPGFFRLWTMDYIFSEKLGKRDFGCFAGSSGFALSPDGIIYPCARFATNKEYPLYNLFTDEIFIDNINFFKNEKITNPKNYLKCQKCNLYNICNAGCLYSQLKNNNEPVTNICKIYKMIFREVKILWKNYPNMFKKYFYDYI